MKVSREGIVLIKSFEGFRPRAIRREDGGWVIGYGHTLSAREGASVSESDAELLLRYDLLPVEQTVNQAASTGLNQHQFDAMASFAFSVGVDRFQTSDVRNYLVDGSTDSAAEALIGWPEAPRPQDALRRRAAERGLFMADPAAPVSVSDLLVAPVSTPSRAEPDAVEQPLAIVDFAPTESAEIIPPQAPELSSRDDAVLDPRAAAVSALLGEVEPTPEPDEQPSASVFVTAAAVEHAVVAAPSAANDAEAGPPSDAAAAPSVDPRADPKAESLHEPEVVGAAPSQPSGDPGAAIETIDTVPATGTTPPPPAVDPVALSIQRYAPYSAPMVGPLPFLPLSDEQDASAVATVTAAVDAVEHAPADTPAASPELPIITPFGMLPEVEVLVLSAPEDAPTPALTRPSWTPEERAEPVEQTDGGLFGEELSLTQGGAPIMRHGDLEGEAPASFDWSETGAFIIMGAVGLTAFGAAMAAFRLASEQSGGDETTIIAWVLAIIGAGCVGVSSFNLYRRWGLPGGDN